MHKVSVFRAVFGLIVVLLLSCGKSPAKKMAGTWVLDLEYDKEKLQEQMAAEEATPLAWILENTDRFRMRFKQDGTISISVRELRIGAWEIEGDEEPYTLRIRINNPNPRQRDARTKLGIRFPGGKKMELVEVEGEPLSKNRELEEAGVRVFFKKVR
jgi:hypothetical protein